MQLIVLLTLHQRSPVDQEVSLRCLPPFLVSCLVHLHHPIVPKLRLFANIIQGGESVDNPIALCDDNNPSQPMDTNMPPEQSSFTAVGSHDTLESNFGEKEGRDSSLLEQLIADTYDTSATETGETGSDTHPPPSNEESF